MTTAPTIRDDADVAVLHELQREITSWRLAGLMASDGRAFLRCTFSQEVGGEPDPEHDGEYVNAKRRAFPVHWELDSLKEFVQHLFVAAGEIERRAAGISAPAGFDLSPALEMAGAASQCTHPDGGYPGYL